MALPPCKIKKSYQHLDSQGAGQARKSPLDKTDEISGLRIPQKHCVFASDQIFIFSSHCRLSQYQKPQGNNVAIRRSIKHGIFPGGWKTQPHGQERKILFLCSYDLQYIPGLGYDFHPKLKFGQIIAFRPNVFGSFFDALQGKNSEPCQPCFKFKTTENLRSCAPALLLIHSYITSSRAMCRGFAW
jgi:hypothetical protein